MNCRVDEEVPHANQPRVSICVDFVGVALLICDNLVHLSALELNLLLVELVFRALSSLRVLPCHLLISPLLVVQL